VLAKPMPRNHVLSRRSAKTSKHVLT
jgi:hypothetical protein